MTDKQIDSDGTMAGSQDGRVTECNDVIMLALHRITWMRDCIEVYNERIIMTHNYWS